MISFLKCILEVLRLLEITVPIYNSKNHAFSSFLDLRKMDKGVLSLGKAR